MRLIITAIAPAQNRLFVKYLRPGYEHALPAHVVTFPVIAAASSSFSHVRVVMGVAFFPLPQGAASSSSMTVVAALVAVLWLDTRPLPARGSNAWHT